MTIETFAMERMQSAWENIVDYDMSESGIRAITLREMIALGFDLDGLLDTPLGYSQSNGTIALRERLAALYPGATADHIEVTNGTSEANYVIALSQLAAGDTFALQVPNYMQCWGVPRSLGATIETFALVPHGSISWTIDWDAFERAVTPKTKLVYITNPNNPTGSVLSAGDMRRIVEQLYARTRTILTENRPIVQDWIRSFGDFLTFIPPAASAMAFFRYASDTPSQTIADWIRANHSTLVVPGTHLGLEGYLRVWTGGKQDYLR